MRWWIFIAMAACTNGPQTLSDLHATRVNAEGNDTLPSVPPSFSVLLETPDCVPLEPDATADFAGYPLAFVREAHDGGCLGWRASLDALAPGAFDGRDTVLTIRDSSETWTIDLLAMHDANVTMTSSTVAAGQTLFVLWSNVPGQIWTQPATGAARLDLTTSTGTFDLSSTTGPGWFFHGPGGRSEVIVPAAATAGPATATIDLSGGYALGNARCEGPAACETSLEVAATFDVTITP
jgi:hypothetical protein